MSTYYSDVVQYLVDFIDNFNGIESPALDSLIYDFLMTRENGYADESVEVYVPDTTSYINILIDTTSPNITVLEWKELYLEEVYNQALRQNGQAGITDDNTPNYPLVDFRGTIQDFDTTTSIDYIIGAGEDSTNYIQYEYASPVSIDGILLQGGDTGLQIYDVIGEWNLLPFYLAYSNNGTEWRYIYNLSGYPSIDATSSDNISYTAGYTTNQSVAENAPFLYYKQAPLADLSISTITFTEKSIESKYWRIFPVDLLPVLTDMGYESGFTGYTASFSHLRFHQIVEHGEHIVSQTVQVETLRPELARGDYEFDTEVGTGVGNWITVVPAFSATYNQWSGISMMYTIQSANSTTNNITNWRFQLQGRNGSWYDIRTGDHPLNETGYYTDVYMHKERDPLTDQGAQFRVQANALAGTTMYIYIAYMVVAVSDKNYFANQP